MLGKLAELESKLRELSHDQTALQIIQSFATDLGNTKQRQIIFGSDGALLRDPIFYQDALEKGLLDEKEDPFNLLQGDIISTNAAYFFGERLEGMKFSIANSTCDLVPNRRQNAMLFRIEAITQARYPDAKSIISQLLKFKSTQRMYLPRLSSDPEEVLANCIIFDGVVQISLDDLQMATREASLSLIGWRIFGSLLRTIMVRAGESEVKLRILTND